MKKRNNITVLASFAKDRLLDKSGSLLCEQKGGPALYIQKALREEKIDFDMPYSPRLDVEILLTSQGEFGRVRTKTKPKKIDWRLLNSQAMMISTILEEYDLGGIETYQKPIFLDVQGYVRNGDDFGRKRLWNFNSDSVFCIKGTDEEISYLPKNFTESQKQKMLLVTLGSKGSILYFQGKKIEVKPERIASVTDTIGAGDSFFAYFVAEFIRSNNSEQSLKYATTKTTSFLSSKLHHANPF